jgi:hypothetical protein
LEDHLKVGPNLGEFKATKENGNSVTITKNGRKPVWHVESHKMDNCTKTSEFLIKYCCNDCSTKLLNNKEEMMISWLLCIDCKSKFISCRCGAYLLKDNVIPDDVLISEHISTDKHELNIEEQDIIRQKSEIISNVSRKEGYHNKMSIFKTPNPKYSYENRLKYVYKQNNL